MEHKYIINLVFEQPYFNNEGTVQITHKTNSLGYEKQKDAKKSFDEFNRKGFIEFNTPAGLVVFRLVSIEFLDVKKHAESKEQEERELNNEGEQTNEENESGSGEQSDGNSGEEQDANGERSNDEDASEA